ncbi:tetratricopeptide repeat protein [Thalassococcus sp. CAU 1522]|uniref:Tetratricopeptide repeat protein n=1 Tax=Thalassococcus arenae TaxID=2851652 RepID=A0ABS6N7V3_9RHOB|nr:tetratricopeptide repeat protein [Thalassococcus arenae]MBV2360078.1 tetratricopeptide repeat protein [Thalassococcus arenae]
MPQTDAYGNRLNTPSPAAREAYDRGVQVFLSGNYGAAEAFRDCVAADPGFGLGHAALARAQMMAGDMASARTSLGAAARLVVSDDTRAQQHVAALQAVLSGRSKEARALVFSHVRDYPRDALTAQLCTNVFGLIGFSGEIGREAELLAYTGWLLPHYGEDWWILSMHALSLCETGRIAASQAMMERALALNSRNAHGAHFKSHAYYEAGETARGQAYLADWITGLDRRSILHGHLNWHAALWALQDGDTAAMWSILDSTILPDTSHGLPLNVLTDTAALLWRAELAGIDVPADRWRQMSDYAAQHFDTPGQSFADMHAALSHAMAGDGDRLARLVEASRGFAADLVRPVASAWGAIARQDWPGALDALVPVLAQSERIGGSRAQRDLLELSHAMVLLRLGRRDEASRALALRRPFLDRPVPVSGLH